MPLQGGQPSSAPYSTIPAGMRCRFTATCVKPHWRTSTCSTAASTAAGRPAAPLRPAAQSAVRPADRAELAPATAQFAGSAERWLDGGLAADAASAQATRWSVIAQQTLFSPRHYPLAPCPPGRPGRLNFAATPAPAVPAFGTRRAIRCCYGDIHQNYGARRVHADAASRRLGRGGQRVSAAPPSVRWSGTTQAKVRHRPPQLRMCCWHAAATSAATVPADITPVRWTTIAGSVVDDPRCADSGAIHARPVCVEDSRAGPRAA